MLMLTRVPAVAVPVAVLVMLVFQQPRAEEIHAQSDNRDGDGVIEADRQRHEHAMHRFARHE